MILLLIGTQHRSSESFLKLWKMKSKAMLDLMAIPAISWDHMSDSCSSREQESCQSSGRSLMKRRSKSYNTLMEFCCQEVEVTTLTRAALCMSRSRKWTMRAISIHSGEHASDMRIWQFTPQTLAWMFSKDWWFTTSACHFISPRIHSTQRCTNHLAKMSLIFRHITLLGTGTIGPSNQAGLNLIKLWRRCGMSQPHQTYTMEHHSLPRLKPRNIHFTEHNSTQNKHLLSGLITMALTTLGSRFNSRITLVVCLLSWLERTWIHLATLMSLKSMRSWIILWSLLNMKRPMSMSLSDSIKYINYFK